MCLAFYKNEWLFLFSRSRSVMINYIKFSLISLFPILLIGGYTLKFELPSGKVYKQRTTITTITKQSVEGVQTENAQLASVTTSLQKGDKVDSSGAPIYELTYNEITMETRQGEHILIVHSDTNRLKKVDPTSEILSQIVNKPFRASIDSTGFIHEVFGLEGIVKAATVSASGIAEVYAKQYSESFGDNGLAKNLEMVTQIWPSEPVEVGDTWSNQQYTPTGLPIILENQYTLTDLNEGVGILDVISEIKTDLKNNTVNMDGMNTTYHLSGQRKGRIAFELKTGWVVEAELNDEIEGSIEIAPSFQIPEGVSIPIEYQNSILVNAL